MKKIAQFITLLTLPLLVSISHDHEYYVSVTNVEYVESQKSLQIVSQIFIDDFENALRLRYDDKLVLESENEPKKVNALMERYMNAKLKFWINGEEVKFDFLGKEYKDDIVYCYLEITNVVDVKSISMNNKILLDVFDSQQNITRFKVFGKNKSFLLVQDNSECMLNFD